MGKQSWLNRIGSPTNYDFAPSLDYIKSYDVKGYTVELYRQANGPSTYQRVMMILPRCLSKPCPGIVVPFYTPEWALGCDPETGEDIEKFATNATMLHLAERGYIAVSAESYHLTYPTHLDRKTEDFGAWRRASAHLNADHPEWSGVGKLIADNRLLVDMLENDERVASERIGVVGHSLGGKIAFYLGCLDERIKAILASDFGIGWNQTNWSAPWYWGDRVDRFIAEGIDHASLLEVAAPKPFCLLAGLYDNADSVTMLESVEAYKKNPSHLLCVNHATGHRPPPSALEVGYGFIGKWL